MKIESIRLKNFKLFQDVSMEGIPPFCVIVGANGTGKSTLLEVFSFLKDCLTHNVGTAIQSRGGYRELVSRGHETENIGIELRIRLERSTPRWFLTYRLEISNKDKKPAVAREILRSQHGASGSPLEVLNFTYGEGFSYAEGTAVVDKNGSKKKIKKPTKDQQKLDKPDILAIKGLGQFKEFKAASVFRELVENWHVSNFHTGSARGSKDAAGYADHLSATGDNLQVVANRLFEEHKDIFDQIIELMKIYVPGINSIEPELTRDGRLLLKFHDGSFRDPFIDKYVSDGTIKMFAYLLLLYDPSPHPLLCVEEPENQLYPTLLWELAEEFRAYATRGGQVFVSTHSPDFLNATRLEEVFWLVKKNGFTQAKRAQNDEQLAALMAEGDQMGYLWKHGFFPEVDPQ